MARCESLTQAKLEERLSFASIGRFAATPRESLAMKAYMLMTRSGPIVVLTSHASLLDNALVEKLAEKGIDKFVAYEIPIALAEQRYGTHFSIVKGNLRETDDLRVLDEDGERAFALFRACHGQ
jgi:hypothetical protein